MTCICPKSNMDQANTIIYQLMMFQVKWSPKPEKKTQKTWYFKKFDYGPLKIQPVKNCLGLATFIIKHCSWNNSLVPLHVLDSHKNMQYSLIFSKIGLVTHYAIKDCLDQHFALCQKLVLLSFIAQISYLKTRCARCIYEHKALIAFDIRFLYRTFKFLCLEMNALKLIFHQAFKKRRKKEHSYNICVVGFFF